MSKDPEDLDYFCRRVNEVITREKDSYNTTINSSQVDTRKALETGSLITALLREERKRCFSQMLKRGEL